MLGRREEEIEREEVERQLREVEMQERMQREAEEQERVQRAREMAERGEVMDPAERDLDDEVPEADQTQQTVEEDGMEEGDLDDEIPDADDDEEEEDDDEDEDDDEEVEDAADNVSASGSGFGEGWTYDSRREPDSDDEEGTAARLARLNGRPPPQQPGGVGVNRASVARAAAALGIPGDSEYGYDVDERQAAALADAMLDEDEMGHLDNAYGQAQDDMLGAEVDVRDLDDEVPDADDGGWEHTDTELEESEMDISVLPGQPMLPPGGRRSSGMPFSSGNRRSTGGARVVSGNATRFSQQQGMTQTPTFEQANALLGSSSVMAANESSAVGDNEAAVQSNRRNWLNAAGTSARRNLFGNARFGGGGGGLFTPSPRQEEEGSPEAEAEGREGQGHRRRRSGRLLGGMGISRRRENRDSVD